MPSPTSRTSSSAIPRPLMCECKLVFSKSMFMFIRDVVEFNFQIVEDERIKRS
eukprot:jgi/Antlo1/1266/665